MKQANVEEIVKILEESDINFKTNARSFIIECPRCNKEKLYIRRSDGVFICFYCDGKERFSGSPEFLLRELCPDYTFPEIKHRLYGDWKQNIKNFRKEEVNTDVETFREVLLPTMAFPDDHVDLNDPKAKKGIEYLESRGIPLDIAKKYNIRYAHNQHRVMFPIEHEGRLYGWQGRFIYNTEFTNDKNQLIKIPKSLTTGEKAKSLMFRDRLTGSEHAVICEGPIDAIKADLCGGNICTMGKLVSQIQIDLIKSSTVSKIYLALDPDAIEEIQKLRKDFIDYKIYDLRAPRPYKDLGEMDFKEVKELFDEARPLTGNRPMFYIKNPYSG